MTQKEAAKKTRYFNEGVSAEIGCYFGEGDWILAVNRAGSRCSFYELDSLKRSVFFLHNQVIQGGELRLADVSRDRYESVEVKFYSPENARSCVGEIRKALEFIQSVTAKDLWHEVPASIFTDFGNPTSDSR